MHMCITNKYGHFEFSLYVLIHSVGMMIMVFLIVLKMLILEIFPCFLGHFHGLLTDLAGDLLQLVHALVDGGLVGLEPGQDQRVVDELGPVQGAHAPQ